MINYTIFMLFENVGSFNGSNVVRRVIQILWRRTLLMLSLLETSRGTSESKPRKTTCKCKLMDGKAELYSARDSTLKGQLPQGHSCS